MSSYVKVASIKSYLLEQLQKRSWIYHTAACPFVLIKVKDGDAVQRRLLEDSIFVRSCRSYDLPQWIRVFPRSRSDIDLLINALERVIK